MCWNYEYFIESKYIKNCQFVIFRNFIYICVKDFCNSENLIKCKNNYDFSNY